MAEGDKKEFTVGEEEYVIQHPGVPWVVKHTDNCRDRNGNLVQADYIQGIFDNVVIKPSNLKLGDFDNTQDMQKVVKRIEQFL